MDWLDVIDRVYGLLLIPLAGFCLLATLSIAANVLTGDIRKMTFLDVIQEIFFLCFVLPAFFFHSRSKVLLPG